MQFKYTEGELKERIRTYRKRKVDIYLKDRNTPVCVWEGYREDFDKKGYFKQTRKKMMVIDMDNVSHIDPLTEWRTVYYEINPNIPYLDEPRLCLRYQSDQKG